MITITFSRPANTASAPSFDGFGGDFHAQCADPFLLDVERFLASTGMSGTMLGIRAVGDSGLIPAMRNGRTCRPKTRERVTAFIADLMLQIAA